MTLIVHLWVKEGHWTEFEVFESKAAAVMERHGGRIEQVFRQKDSTNGPDEIHIVRFENAEGFEAYRTDAELRALSELRAKAIQKTEVWAVDELPAYGIR